MGDIEVAVIGAGIVGSTIALELRRRGRRVTLIDRDEPGRGCSFGNSGAISASSVAPLAMPGVLASVPRMLIDRDSPLRVPLAYAPFAMPWLVRFVASATRARVEASASALAALHADAAKRHRALARDVGVPELVLDRGHLYLYADRAALEKDSAVWELRRRHGCKAETLDRAGIVALEPEVHARYAAAMFLRDHVTVRNPFRYVEAIAKAFVACGGALRRAEVETLSRSAGGWTVTMPGDSIDAESVVVAAGAWSRRLLDAQGLRLPLETQRGYHVEFDGALPVSRSVVLTDRRVFVTPMETGLRVGGTVEIAGLSAPPDWRRADALVSAVRAAFPELTGAPARRWMGHRPCLPDSVPYVGAVPGRPGLYAAVGHGHLGLTDAPATAERIARLVAAGEVAAPNAV